MKNGWLHVPPHAGNAHATMPYSKIPYSSMPMPTPTAVTMARTKERPAGIPASRSCENKLGFYFVFSAPSTSRMSPPRFVVKRTKPFASTRKSFAGMGKYLFVALSNE